MRFVRPIDIIELILEAGNNKQISKAEIICKTLLPPVQLNHYLDSLLKYELLSYQLSTQSYTTTIKGIYYLAIYGDIHSQTAPNFTQ
jgi:predicted transcriptional regulator